MAVRASMTAVRNVDRFEGHIAGLGSQPGLRIVVGIWKRSPMGAFTDVMVQQPDGERILLAPNELVAEYVNSTYWFDDVVVTPIDSRLSASKLELQAGPLALTADIGQQTLLGRTLSALPGRLAEHPVWLRAISPFAAALVPGVRTSGTAGQGRREYYGVRSLHRITGITGSWKDTPLGYLTPVTPAVTFSFSSVPATPAIARVVTSIEQLRKRP